MREGEVFATFVNSKKIRKAQIQLQLQRSSSYKMLKFNPDLGDMKERKMKLLYNRLLQPLVLSTLGIIIWHNVISRVYFKDYY